MKTILHVEDDSNDVFFFRRAMNKNGVLNPVQVVSDGRQAIDYLQGAGKFADREKFPLPGLVLLDLKLPYVMGLDVLRWIRQQCGSELIVLLLTASSEEADIAAAYRLGANGFLVKPSDASELEDMVKGIHQFWLVHNTSPGGSPRRQPPAPAHSTMIDPAPTPLPGERPEPWQPVILYPKPQPNERLGL
jgi:CheY-like chemotaxis protein